MKLAIMQPYFVPYIGYWQLINAVDEYVIYDDVNFIKGGCINRNRILVNGEWKFLNVPMSGASSNKLISEVYVNADINLIKKRLRMVQNAYGKAPYYSEVYPIVESIFRCGQENLSEYIIASIRIICTYLGITTKLVRSSELKKNSNLKSQSKVLDICRLLGATEYYNAIGGRNLYSSNDFAREGISLKFLQTDEIVYEQFGNEFQDSLSIIDVMMFNSKEEIQTLLYKYTLI